MAQPSRYESRVTSFDESEFADSREEDAVAQTLAGLEEEVQEAASEDIELSDVDLRLETADYYRAILNHEFFNVSSPAAQVVDREIRGYIRERLEVLLGLRAPRAETAQAVLPFSDDQIEALKAVADKVVALKGPQVKKMPTPGEPVRPDPRQVIKAKPQVRKIPAPAQAPSTKPKAKPVAKPPEAPAAKQQAQAQAPVPKQQLEPGVEGGITQTFIGLDQKKVTLTEGEIIEENGRRFQVVANGAGTLYRKDITGQVVPPNRLPPMTPQQISIASQQMAEQQLGHLDDLTGMAVFHSIANK